MDKNHDSSLLEGFPNCWEVMECEKGVCMTCPAYPDHGKECWKVTGTLCDHGRLRKTDLSEKIIHCRSNCEYYRQYIKKIYP